MPTKKEKLVYYDPSIKSQELLFGSIAVTAIAAVVITCIIIFDKERKKNNDAGNNGSNDSNGGSDGSDSNDDNDDSGGLDDEVGGSGGSGGNGGGSNVWIAWVLLVILGVVLLCYLFRKQLLLQAGVLVYKKDIITGKTTGVTLSKEYFKNWDRSSLKNWKGSFATRILYTVGLLPEATMYYDQKANKIAEAKLEKNLTQAQYEGKVKTEAIRLVDQWATQQKPPLGPVDIGKVDCSYLKDALEQQLDDKRRQGKNWPKGIYQLQCEEMREQLKNRIIPELKDKYGLTDPGRKDPRLDFEILYFFKKRQNRELAFNI